MTLVHTNVDFLKVRFCGSPVGRKTDFLTRSAPYSFTDQTKETNVAHAPHHPKNPLKFSQIHSKRGNMRNGGCSAVIVNIHRMFPKGRYTMNAKMISHLKDLGITLSL